MAWLAVDKDGAEKISSGVLMRRRNYKSVMWGLGVLKYSKNNRNKWANAWNTDSSDAMPFTGIILPSGSIQKLIGRELTWEDSPVEI